MKKLSESPSSLFLLQGLFILQWIYSYLKLQIGGKKRGTRFQISLPVHIFFHKNNHPYFSTLEELWLNDMNNMQQIWPRRKYKKKRTSIIYFFYGVVISMQSNAQNLHLDIKPLQRITVWGFFTNYKINYFIVRILTWSKHDLRKCSYKSVAISDELKF